MRILAATDGSRQAQSAVRFAAWLASAFRAGRLEIILVGDVGEELISQGGGKAARLRSPMVEDYRSWAQRALDRAAREALRLGVKTRCHYVEASLAPVADVLSRAADVKRADLLVVGSAGRGAAGRALFGSVARRLVHVARRPVVVVPAPVAARKGDALRILAATDGSRGSAAAIRLAASLVRRARRGRLEALTVGTLRRDLAMAFSSAVLAFVPYGELQETERRTAARILQQAARAARAGGARVKLRFLEPRSSRPIAELLALEARRTGVHLVVVGTEGRGTIARWALGSVTERLLSASRRPVLVVRPSGRTARSRGRAG